MSNNPRMTGHRNAFQSMEMAVELETYAQRLNITLRDEKLVEHLLPIQSEDTGEDLLDKLRDGILLAVYIAQIPGGDKVLSLGSLKIPKLGKPLHLAKCMSNYDLVLNAADQLKVVGHGATASDFVEPSTLSAKKVCCFIRHLMDIETLTDLGFATAKLHELLGLSPLPPDMTESGLVLDVLHILTGEESSNSDITALLRDMRVYLSILNVMTEAFTPEDLDYLLSPTSNPYDRSDAVVNAAKSLPWVELYIKSQDLMYGGKNIHVMFVTALATSRANTLMSAEDRRLSGGVFVSAAAGSAGLVIDEDGTNRNKKITERFMADKVRYSVHREVVGGETGGIVRSIEERAEADRLAQLALESLKTRKPPSQTSTPAQSLSPMRAGGASPSPMKSEAASTSPMKSPSKSPVNATETEELLEDSTSGDLEKDTVAKGRRWERGVKKGKSKTKLHFKEADDMIPDSVGGYDEEDEEDEGNSSTGSMMALFKAGRKRMTRKKVKPAAGGSIRAQREAAQYSKLDEIITTAVLSSPDTTLAPGEVAPVSTPGGTVTSQSTLESSVATTAETDRSSGCFRCCGFSC